MKSSFRQSFTRDLKRLKDPAIRERIRQIIEQIEAAQTLSDVKDLAKLSSGNNYYRIRAGDYRIGFIDMVRQ